MKIDGEWKTVKFLLHPYSLAEKSLQATMQLACIFCWWDRALPEYEVERYSCFQNIGR